jgi:LysM repeat protein
MNMNTPNPLVPQGTFAEASAKSRTRLVVFSILAAHLVFVGVLLLQGCKRTPTEPIAPEPTNQFANIEPLPFTPPASPTNPWTPPAIGGVTTSTPPDVVTPTNEPPPLPPPTNSPPAAEKEHKIVKGDTFEKLGKKYGVGWKAIVEANPGVDPAKLKPDMIVKIPEAKAKAPAPTGNGVKPAGEAAKTYVVQSGDNLLKLSKKFGVSVKALRSANGLKTDRIKVGDKLKIPVKAAAPAAPAEKSAPAGTIPGVN